MAKNHNFVRELHLVCKEHRCMFKDCACEKRDWSGKHDWVLVNNEELERFFKTGEINEGM